MDLHAETLATCDECGKPAAMLFHGLCRNCIIESYDMDDDREGDEPYDDCGLMPDGQCMRAGSEECDWECGRLRRP